MSPSSNLPAGTLGPYLVGGAVRDGLLGLKVKDRDWLLAGVSPAQLLEAGFHQVGRQFSVFLHPTSHEEYALPRAGEVGHSHQQAIEEDLRRRDLTINALAQAPDGQLLDPCGGLRDLEQRILRHTPFFHQDPLRTLRLAKFHARFAAMGFRIAPETLALTREIAASGALEKLPAERIYQELEQGLGGPAPHIFVRSLHDTGLLEALLPEVERLFGVPQPAIHHPEVDTGEHLLLALEAYARLSGDPAVGFAVLLHDVGKGLTPRDQWPRHLGHEEAGVAPARIICQRLGLPKQTTKLVIATVRYHLLVHRALELRPRTLLKLLTRLDAVRNPRLFHHFLLACQADSQGRLGFHHKPFPQADYLSALLQQVRGLDQPSLIADCANPAEIGKRLQRERLRVIASSAQAWKNPAP